MWLAVEWDETPLHSTDCYDRFSVFHPVSLNPKLRTPPCLPLLSTSLSCLLLHLLSSLSYTHTFCSVRYPYCMSSCTSKHPSLNISLFLSHSESESNQCGKSTPPLSWVPAACSQSNPRSGSELGAAFRPLSRVAQEIMEICSVDQMGCEDPDLDTDTTLHTLHELEQELRLTAKGMDTHIHYIQKFANTPSW